MTYLTDKAKRALEVACASLHVGTEIAELLTYVTLNAGAPSDGTSGTFAGIAPKGALLIDTTNAKLYINTNTTASPTWTLVGSQT